MIPTPQQEKKGVVFDMDDTLYLERDYVKSGFRAVAEHIGAVADSDAVFAYIWQLFESGARGNTFDQLMAKFPDVAAAFEIPDLVHVYRAHKPDISIIPEMRHLISALRYQGLKIGLLSDGPLISQQAKYDALGVSLLADEMLLTDSMGRQCWKPSPVGFQRLAERMGVANTSLVYIGDNPIKDFIAPRSLGWRTIRLRLAGQLRENLEPDDSAAAPHAEARSVAELSRCISEALDGH